MALFIGNSNIVPRSISASSPKLLEKNIHRLQMTEGMEYKFISIYYDPQSKKHIAWYYIQLTEDQIIKESLNDTKK